MKLIQLRLYILAACLTIVLAPCGAQGQELTFVPFHSSAIYALGERVGWTAHGSAASSDKTYQYTIKENNWTVLKKGTLHFVRGAATISIRLRRPAMVFVTVTRPSAHTPHAATEGHVVAHLGAAVAPLEIKPCMKPPADFNAFWASKIKALNKIPMHPQLTPLASPQAGVKLYQVKLASLGSHVQGYLAKPAKPGKFPALIIYQWAGVYKLDPTWAASRAAQGWLALDVDSHDLPPDQGTGVPNDYPTIGDTSRDTSYFLDMYLRDTRALEYMRSRPDWNGRTVVVTGTSMGGQQSLVTAGLNPGKIDAVIVDEPSGADTNGVACARRTGYPFWQVSNPKVAQTARYFDVVNFAPHITATAMIAMGFIDETATPVGLWTVFNEIHAPKEAVPMILSAHNNITLQFIGPFIKNSEAALTQILKTGKFVPKTKFAH